MPVQTNETLDDAYIKFNGWVDEILKVSDNNIDLRKYSGSYTIAALFEKSRNTS